MKLYSSTLKTRMGIGQVAGHMLTLWPGFLVCAVIALAATFISEHQGGPQLLYALLIGLACNFLAGSDRVMPGVSVCARTGLRCGVALLGARITIDKVASLGIWTGVGIAVSVVATILFGVVLATFMRRPREEGLRGARSASAALRRPSQWRLPYLRPRRTSASRCSLWWA